MFYGVWTGKQEGQEWCVLWRLDRRTVETGGVYGAFVRVASLGVPNRHAL